MVVAFGSKPAARFNSSSVATKAERSSSNQDRNDVPFSRSKIEAHGTSRSSVRSSSALYEWDAVSASELAQDKRCHVHRFASPIGRFRLRQLSPTNPSHSHNPGLREASNTLQATSQDAGAVQPRKPRRYIASCHNRLSRTSTERPPLLRAHSRTLITRSSNEDRTRQHPRILALPARYRRRSPLRTLLLLPDLWPVTFPMRKRASM